MVGASPQILLHFRQQRWQRTMAVIARDLVVQVTEDTLNGIRFRAVAWQPEQDKTWMARQPAADVPGSVNTIVVCHHVHAPKAYPGVSAVQRPEQIQK